jgi:hypothetical protein
MIHDASNAQMQTALTKIEKLDCVKNTPRMMRVETFS